VVPSNRPQVHRPYPSYVFDSLTGTPELIMMVEPFTLTSVVAFEGSIQGDQVMSTFTQDTANARRKQASAPKDDATKEDVRTAEGEPTPEGQAEVPADDPNKPTEILDESEQEKSDRHIASTELPAGEVTDPATQGDSSEAEDAAEKIVPGAAAGPDDAGVVRNDHGRVAYAPPGSLDAAFNGVQQDASGHVDSVGTDNSDRSNTRI
jgi:hypothetical protein